ncbi:MAG TPA: DUF3341 domain-containing protein [Verrucomicrobiae bacterium]|jgi:hypothetical protein|nr:DUF3341 domain-containing protein [Verrucomicrobiae bacterium]
MSAGPEVKSDLWGILAEFETPEALVEAARKVTKAGYKRFDAYSPFPIEGLHEAMNFHRNRLPLLVLIGGILGGLAGFGMQYYANVFSFPLNIGGKPHNSWPAFIPITFELTILGAAFAAVFGMLALNGLPMPYHPLFNVERFALATRDRFYLCIESRDKLFDPDTTKSFLESLKPHGIYDVDR